MYVHIRHFWLTYGEKDEGAGWDSEELAGDREAYGSIDEDGAPEPELLFDASLLNAAGGVGQIAAGNVNRNLLKDMAKRGWASISKSTHYGFLHLSRNLHFSANSDPDALRDRAWKLRPIIDALQARFQAGYFPPPTLAFDETMLPSQSSFNRMRVFMKDKPHRWGKLFMLCCSTTAFEVYCGKQENPSDGALTDYDAGPAAVVRNLREVFGPSGPRTGSMRVIVTNRFYTSVPLALQLLTMGFYSIGTIQTDRLGLPVSIIGEKKEGEKKK
ncbi:unnamed protein product [Phytophthora fragariaefolia]|uniref:Unnamed protein product n=1 Tax=Phytophthora fragariaefolia TaxID=1490495 RepID=A0A9W6XJ81_9STRA|nr:unnamed protein product [Phytophthora fragariaefolia]